MINNFELKAEGRRCNLIAYILQRGADCYPFWRGLILEVLKIVRNPFMAPELEVHETANVQAARDWPDVGD
jgi:hypothetical protein